MWYIVLRLKTKVAKIKINGITVFTLILKDRKSSGTVLDAWLKCVMFYIITFLGHLSKTIHTLSVGHHEATQEVLNQFTKP